MILPTLTDYSVLSDSDLQEEIDTCNKFITELSKTELNGFFQINVDFLRNQLTKAEQELERRYLFPEIIK